MLTVKFFTFARFTNKHTLMADFTHGHLVNITSHSQLYSIFA